MTAPLAIDLFCGLGGWSEGLLAEGWFVVGFDIERHEYGGQKYPGQLVLQDVLTLHGSQFRDADLIVASPPCQAYSYRAMPWSRAKALPPPDNILFDACFRIQREACEAAGRHIPLIVENVRGAQKWVGQSRAKWGPYHLWGDVPAVLPDATGVRKGEGSGRSWFYQNGGNARSASSRSKERREWSARVAKIPFPLARHIARVFKPKEWPMVAINFSPEFADAVASGKKLQTIRRTRRCSPGDAMTLYTGQRTAHCRKLGDAICESVDYIGIRPDGLTFGDVRKHHRDIDDFARADGFEDFPAMLAWFEKTYGSPYFTGYVHRWRLIAPAKSV